jgi:hypothetical protein
MRSVSLRLPLHWNQPNSTNLQFRHIVQCHHKTEENSGGCKAKIMKSRSGSRHRASDKRRHIRRIQEQENSIHTSTSIRLVLRSCSRRYAGNFGGSFSWASMAFSRCISLALADVLGTSPFPRLTIDKHEKRHSGRRKNTLIV